MIDEPRQIDAAVPPSTPGSHSAAAMNMPSHDATMVSPVAAMPTIFPAIRSTGAIDDSSTSTSLLDFSSTVFVSSICVIEKIDIHNR